jgi:DNA-binding response OmpR family regulator
MKMDCAGAVKNGMGRKCIFLNLMVLTLQRRSMIKIAFATSCENLAQKISAALSSFQAVLSRYQSLSDLPSALDLKRFDLIVIHHPKEIFEEEMYISFEQNLPRSIPSIAITSDKHIESSVQLLNAGIDRCLPESFDKKYFCAMVRALTRRSHGLISSVSQYGALCFSHETQQTWIHDKQIALTKREAQVLDILLRRVGQIISKVDIVEVLDFNNNADINASAVEVYIHRLRKKIKSEYLPIRNIKRCGYFLRRFDPSNESAAYGAAHSYISRPLSA